MRLRLCGLAPSPGAPARGVRQELVGSHLTRDSSDVAFLEGAFRAEGHLDRLLDVGTFRGLCVAVDADDAEENLGICLASAVSKAVTFGEPTLL